MAGKGNMAIRWNGMFAEGNAKGCALDGYWMLTKPELLFLKPQDLGPDDVFDAKGRSIKDVKDEAQGTGQGAGRRRALWLRRTSSTHAARPLRQMQTRNARFSSALGSWELLHCRFAQPELDKSSAA